MVPFLLFLFTALALWLAVVAMRDRLPPERVVTVLRVRDAETYVEAALRAAQRAGLDRLVVVDDGSRDLTVAIVTLWARTHPGVEVVRAGEVAGVALTAICFILDLRQVRTAESVDAVLTWLGERRWAPALAGACAVVRAADGAGGS